MKFEMTCLYMLIENDYYFFKVFPYLNDDFFKENNSKIIFSKIQDFFKEKNEKPSIFIIEQLLNEELKNESLNNYFNEIKKIKIKFNENSDNYYSEIDKFIEITEREYQDKRIIDSILTIAEIVKDKKKKKDRNEIRNLIEKSLSVSFDDDLGHSFTNFKDRWENYYKKKDFTRITSGFKTINQILNGGWKPKSLNLFVAKTGGGKTYTLVNLALGALKEGKNIVYYTLEVSDDEISERMDSALLGIPMSELTIINSEKEYFRKVDILNLEKLE